MIILTSPDWQADCQKWRGRLLTGKHAHWCAEWGYLPVDETCAEWPCGCVTERKETEDARYCDC